MRSPDGLLPEDAAGVRDCGSSVFSERKKFSPGRQIVEDRAHFDCVPGASPPSRTGFDLAASHDDLRARDRVGFAVVNRKRERLADAGSVHREIPGSRLPPDRPAVRIFARGVALEGKQRIVAIHPEPVIDDTNERNTAAPDADLDLRAPASMLFSTSSFTTDAGRSITSPAATWLARNFRQQADATHDVFQILRRRFAIAKENDSFATR